MTVWNIRNSYSGHELRSPTTSVIIFNWSFYLQLENATLNLWNLQSIDLLIEKWIIHAMVGIIFWNKQIKEKKIPNLRLKNSKSY